MHDIRLIRENPEAFDAALARRGAEPVAAQLIDLDERRRAVSTRMQEAQGRRNDASKAIGQAMAQGDKDRAEALKAEVAQIKTDLPGLEEEDRTLGAELDALLAAIPNLPADDVPHGADENHNVEVSRWGTPREFDFAPLEHADIGPALGMDFETGAAISGARFTFLRGGMARLHRALAQFMLDRQTVDNGYTECAPPLMVWDSSLYGTGQLPKFKNDLYAVETNYTKLINNNKHSGFLMREMARNNEFSAEQMQKLNTFMRNKIAQGVDVSQLAPIFEDFRVYFHDFGNKFNELKLLFQGIDREIAELESRNQNREHYLIPTAEVSLTNSVREQILDHAALPIRMTALTPCFRSEAGAAGKDTRGFIRQHQFEKVELVSVCRPEDWEAEHEHMVACAEGVLQALNLPYRKVLLCTGDMGFGARKTYDLEVWLPGQQAYREISSISWCGDFQARRMNARYKPDGAKKTEFVHTLNGSGLAVGRTLVAVLENYQQKDGTVTVPPVLASYMGGINKLATAT